MIRGKPTEELLKAAYKLYKQGKMLKDILEELNIGRTYYYRHKREFKRFYRLREELESKGGTGQKKVHGRKGFRKFTLDMRKKLLQCISNDLTMDTACALVGINKQTVYNWCREYPSFKREMDTAREENLLKIKEALTRAAIGGRSKEITTRIFYDNRGRRISTEVTEKIVPIKANVRAQEFSLINRENWRRDTERSTQNNQGTILDALKEMTKQSKDDEKESEQYEE